ncbi:MULTISPECIES: hypothetical protein [Paenibacillus]|uniref:DUF2207 domain-containing protein n=1 Tax=Paenibacillus campinasensis TaxID=66347 RepID=A0A268F3B7_9BACL|nr:MULTISPECIES: hypothetical protein [Paenibacillus]MUG64884.1 hypothetical protein [Paenibacillus campinasensis]PAD79859.1 hypothetical protein CHH67_02490 [Paenibacillus campinasensis]PAK53473.1 hypothetical protein CHH75_09450 [Paenibacillus sp. 7541]
MRRHAIIFWTAITLAALGIISMLFNPSTRNYVLIPVIVVGVVYLLYKFPPRTKRHPKVKPSKRTAAKLAAKNNGVRKSSPPSKRKQYPFQVIEGQKGKSDPSDDLPKYH